MSSLTFPRFMRFTDSYRRQEPLAARICREHCQPVIPKRILFLDDNTTLRDMLIETVLRDYHADFVGVGTVTEARREIEAGGIAAALLDIRLGDGNGIDLYAEIARRWPAMEIVFLTAWDDTMHRQLIEAIGPARVFSKSRLADLLFVERLLAQLHVGKKTAPACA